MARQPTRRRLPAPAAPLFFLLVPLLGLSVLPLWSEPLATLWIAYLLFVILLVGFDLMKRPGRVDVRVSRKFEAEYRLGKRGAYWVRVENVSSRRLEVRLREVLPPSFSPPEESHTLWLDPGEVVDAPVRFLGLERGAFRLETHQIALRRPLGLFSYQHASGQPSTLVVLPGRPSAETAALLSKTVVLEEMGKRRVRRRGYDSDFESLRDYVVGDDLRFVDWKATARRLRPQVRQFQMERNAEVILALDCGRLMGSLVRGVRKLDLAIVPVLDLAAVALRGGERVGLLAFDSQVLTYVPPRGGLSQLGTITDTLARLPTSFRQTSYSSAVEHLQIHHKKRSLVVVFTDFTDDLSSRDLQLCLSALSRRHVMLFVAVGDQHLEDVLVEEPTQLAAVYQKAAASELLGERARVVEGLGRSGVLTVDADPLHLSAPLIQRYIDARTRV